MLDYSCEAWKNYLDILTRMVTQAQKQLADVKWVISFHIISLRLPLNKLYNQLAITFRVYKFSIIFSGNSFLFSKLLTLSRIVI